MITGLALLAATAAGLIYVRRLAWQVRAFLSWSSVPLNLGIARVVIFGLLAFTALHESVAWFAGLPHGLLAPPVGAGWVASVLPIEPRLARFAVVGTVAASCLAALGIWTRATAAAAAVASVYALGIPELWGKVNHYHNLCWFAAILAASPCGDAFSVDALRRRGPQPMASRVYGLPLRVIALLLGFIYFFPGIWKASVGDAWWWSDNLRNQLHLRWLEADMLPALRIDGYPLLLRAIALSVVIFELSFLLLILWPRTRVAAIIGGLTFHASSALAIGINFWSVWPCYVVLVDWASLASPREESRLADNRSLWLVGVVSAVILGGAIVAGLLRVNSWPFAVYPEFAFLAGPTHRSAELAFVAPNGDSIPSTAALARVRARMESSRLSALQDRILAAGPLGKQRDDLARGFLDMLGREDVTLRRATTILVYDVSRPTDPAQWADASRRLVGQVSVIR